MEARKNDDLANKNRPDICIISCDIDGYWY
jgi:hypothetical protein